MGAMADEANELRQFLREFLVRFDRIIERHDQRLEEEMARHADRFDALTREIRDHREETRAQTQAILRLLDRMSRFDGNGGEAPA